MKRNHRILGLVVAFLLLQFSTFNAFAGDINRQTARQLASNFMSVKTGEKSLKAADMELVYEIPNTEKGIPAIYFFNSANGGFVVLSGNDCMDPVIAYSAESNIDPNNIPPAMLWYLQNFVDNICYYQNNNVQPDAQHVQMWKDLSVCNVQPDNAKYIYKTIKSIWNQDYPFNYYSPMVTSEDGTDTDKAPVGCVATAMAMICKYWSYPVNPTGYISYYWTEGKTRLSARLDTVQFNYDLMPDTAFRGNSYTTWWNDAQIKEVSKLDYMLGLVNHMDFGYEGSGSVTQYYGVDALTKYFKFDKDSIQELSRTSAQWANYTGTPNEKDTLWAETMGEEVHKKRPVFYTGHDNSSGGVHAGHAFIMERYNTTTKQGWFNWGWGGSGDCWCNVISSTLRTNGYNFSSSHYVIIGIQPPADTLNAGENVAINTVSNETSIAPIYPNPSNNWISVPYELGDQNSATLEIVTLDGRVMERRTVFAANNKTSINVSNYAKGVYVCRINGVTRKFVVE